MHDLFSALASAGGPLWAFIAALVALAFLTALMLTMLRDERARGETAAQVGRLADIAERLTMAQAELAGRLQQTQVGIDQRLDGLARRLGEGLLQQTERTGETLQVLHERLALIDAAQKTIAELSTQVVGLHDILANKQARGAFGEVQLEALVRSMLPPGAFEFQATLSNRCRVDCLLRLPDPPGPMAIDAKFPLESFQALREARDEPARVRASRAFAQDVLKHVRDIQAKYILAGETSDSALMFLPSEAVYAELHSGFRNAVEESWRRKVWIVSPSTLWATLNTVRAVLRDVRLREQAGLIQAELRAIAGDVTRLDQRAANLQRHFDQAADDVRQIRISSDKLATRACRLDLAEIAVAEGDDGGGDDAPALPRPLATGAGK
jgi:DNA recombination protein RmuC